MAFTKGFSGNPSGRPTGSKNKTTGQLRLMISGFLEDRFEQVIQDFDLLDPKDRLKVYTDLLQYGLPKLQAVSNTIGLEDLNEEQLDDMISKILESHVEA